jgi:hypothetical protein
MRLWVPELFLALHMQSAVQTAQDPRYAVRVVSQPVSCSLPPYCWANLQQVSESRRRLLYSGRRATQLRLSGGGDSRTGQRDRNIQTRRRQRARVETDLMAEPLMPLMSLVIPSDGALLSNSIAHHLRVFRASHRTGEMVVWARILVSNSFSNSIKDLAGVWISNLLREQFRM